MNPNGWSRWNPTGGASGRDTLGSHPRYEGLYAPRPRYEGHERGPNHATYKQQLFMTLSYPVRIISSMTCGLNE